nr:sodium:solute symporter [Burkholderiaceae bacterium]
GTPIYELVSKAYQFPVVGAFWPLVCGLYWQRSTTQGAICSIVLGMGTWALLEFSPLGQAFPPVLGGFLMAGVGMFGGSLLSPPDHRIARTA